MSNPTTFRTLAGMSDRAVEAERALAKAKKTIAEYERAIDAFRDVLRERGESALGTPAQVVEALCARHAEHLGKIAGEVALLAEEGLIVLDLDADTPTADEALRLAVAWIEDLSPKSTVLDGEQQRGEW